MEKNADIYEIWTDGCALEEGRYMGAGWVIHKNGAPFTKSSVPLPAAAKGSSMQAELRAAFLAVSSIPAGSAVRLYTDCEYILNGLGPNGGKLSRRVETRGGETARITRDLFNLAANCASLTVTRATDQDRDERMRQHMRAAHNQARTGADAARAAGTQSAILRFLKTGS